MHQDQEPSVETSDSLPTGSRRYSRLGNLRYKLWSMVCLLLGSRVYWDQGTEQREFGQAADWKSAIQQIWKSSLRVRSPGGRVALRSLN